MPLELPQLSLVLLLGGTDDQRADVIGAFAAAEVVSMAACRAAVGGDLVADGLEEAALKLLEDKVEHRLRLRLWTVVDADTTLDDVRGRMLKLAKRYHFAAVALVFPKGEVDDPGALLGDEAENEAVERRIHAQSRARRMIKHESFHTLHYLTAQETDLAILRVQPRCNMRQLTGPFDIIGDIHGCYDELCELLQQLGYQLIEAAIGTDRPALVHPEGRRPIFLGDLVDRGPKTPQVLALVHHVVSGGIGWCVAGNHEKKLLRYLTGKKVKLTYGIAESVAQLERCTAAFRALMTAFLDNLPAHFELDGGRLVVAHAGLPEAMHGRSSGAVTAFALFGQTTGETDDMGLPVRYDWAQDYGGQARVVYGHTPVPDSEWVNRAICVDNGCVFGGKLTALRYPELELVSVPARRVYYRRVALSHEETAETSGQA